MPSAYRRRQLLIVSSILGVLILPWAGYKLWHAIKAFGTPSVASLYGEWRVEPYDIGGVRLRLPVAQYLKLQQGKVSIDQLPALPSTLTVHGDQLELSMDRPQLGSISLALTIESNDRMSYTIPLIGSKIYYQRVSAQP